VRIDVLHRQLDTVQARAGQLGEPRRSAGMPLVIRLT
jgi:hypothetical protein